MKRTLLVLWTNLMTKSRAAAGVIVISGVNMNYANRMPLSNMCTWMWLSSLSWVATTNYTRAGSLVHSVEWIITFILCRRTAVGFMFHVFTCMPADDYRRWFRSLLLCPLLYPLVYTRRGDVSRALLLPFVCLFVFNYLFYLFFILALHLSFAGNSDHLTWVKLQQPQG